MKIWTRWPNAELRGTLYAELEVVWYSGKQAASVYPAHTFFLSDDFFFFRSHDDSLTASPVLKREPTEYGLRHHHYNIRPSALDEGKKIWWKTKSVFDGTC